MQVKIIGILGFHGLFHNFFLDEREFLRYYYCIIFVNYAHISEIIGREDHMEKRETFDKYAIFTTGGKQYQAVEGKTLGIEKLEGEAGDKVEFKEVLFRKAAPGQFEIGKPILETPIKASIVKQTQGPKVVSFRFKRRKKVRVKRGHRQPITVVRFESV